MDINITVECKPGALLPAYQTEGAAGMDLHAYSDKNIYLLPNRTTVVDTGIKIQIPIGFEGQIRSRSGLASKNTIIVLNSPGTIDSDYRGWVKVILHNFSHEQFIIKPGDRIAQLVISPVIKANLVCGIVDETTRSDGGLGSTGTNIDKTTSGS